MRYVRAVFIGADGSMGLKCGNTYYVTGYVEVGYYWVQWVTRANPVIGVTATRRCPYSSVDKVLENWKIFTEVTYDAEAIAYSTRLYDTQYEKPQASFISTIKRMINRRNHVKKSTKLLDMWRHITS